MTTQTHKQDTEYNIVARMAIDLSTPARLKSFINEHISVDSVMDYIEAIGGKQVEDDGTGESFSKRANKGIVSWELDGSDIRVYVNDIVLTVHELSCLLGVPALLLVVQLHYLEKIGLLELDSDRWRFDWAGMP